MKKTLLFATLLVGGLTKLSAQCVIMPTCTMGPAGYCTTPAENTSLPTATVGALYNTNIQVSIGATSFGGAATIMSATLTSVTGLPTGISYSINPPSGVVGASSNACVLLTGTPAVGTAGSYTVVATVYIQTNVGGGPGTVSWFLTVAPSIATGITNYTTSNPTSLFMAPNPATNELFIASSSHIGKVNVIDALGKIVLTQDANYSNQTTLNVQNLTKGVYFVQIIDNNELITKKFIKD